MKFWDDTTPITNARIADAFRYSISEVRIMEMRFLKGISLCSSFSLYLPLSLIYFFPLSSHFTPFRFLFLFLITNFFVKRARLLPLPLSWGREDVHLRGREGGVEVPFYPFSFFLSSPLLQALFFISVHSSHGCTPCCGRGTCVRKVEEEKKEVESEEERKCEFKFVFCIFSFLSFFFLLPLAIYTQNSHYKKICIWCILCKLGITTCKIFISLPIH